MGRFADEMTRLRSEIDDLAASRMMLIDELIQGVASMESETFETISGFRKAREEMSDKERKARAEFLGGLSAYVAGMRESFGKERADVSGRFQEELDKFMSDVKSFVGDLGREAAQMQEGFRRDRAGKALKLRAELKESVDCNRASVADLKSRVEEMQRNFRDAFAETSNADRRARTDFVSEMKSDNAALRDSFRSARSETAEKMKADFAESMRGLKDFAGELRTSVAQTQAGFRDSRMEAAQKGAEERREFVSDIVSSVTDIRNKTRSFRDEFIEDWTRACAAWSKPDWSEAEPEAKAEPEVVAKEPEAKAEPKVVAEATAEETAETSPGFGGQGEKYSGSNDLTYIQGIGTGRLKQLNEAGIYTFKQLAESTPEELRAALGETSRLVDLNKWIERAKDFA